MKLRIQGDSLRLRMTQSEVAFLHNCGCIESTIRFAPGRVLSYSVASSTDAAEVSVHLRGRFHLRGGAPANCDRVGGGHRGYC